MHRAADTNLQDHSDQTSNIYPFGGRPRRSFLERLKSWWQTYVSGGRLEVVRRIWLQLSLYSSGLAVDFLRAFCLLSPHLSVVELAHWANLGLRLSYSDTKLATEFFRSGSNLILQLPPQVRAQLFALNAGPDHFYHSETMLDRFRSGFAIAGGTTDYKLVTRIFDVATTIAQSSAGYSRGFLSQAAAIIPHYRATNFFQKALFLHALDLFERFPETVVQLPIKLLSAAAPFIIAARSEGSEAHTTLLCERLMQHTESLISAGYAGGVQFFLSGLELLQLSDKMLIDKWASLCSLFAEASSREFTNFTKCALEPTKALVSLALPRGKHGSVMVATVFDSTMDVVKSSEVAATNCYSTSSVLLGRMSLVGYKAWVERGLASFTDPERLKAYFAAESRSSRGTIAETSDTLRLEDVALVLTNYVKMLTGKILPLVPQSPKCDLLEPRDGEFIELPPAIMGLGNAEHHFRFYKALAAQAAGQIEFGTCEAGTDELRTLGAMLQQRFPRSMPMPLDSNIDWYALITLFPQSNLARRLFTVLENARIERRLRQRYRGLCRDLDLVRSERLRSRPLDQYIMKYEPLLELLFAEALANGADALLDSRNVEQQAWIGRVREVLSAHIYTNSPSVADTIRACLDLYEYLDPEAPSSSIPRQDPHKHHNREESNEQQAREKPSRNASKQLSSSRAEERSDEPTATAENQALFESDFRIQAVSVGLGGSLEDLHESDVYYYDEWDCQISDYRSRWCRVVECDTRCGDLGFVARTRAAYRGVLSQVRYQFQLLRPVGLKRMRGQPDGDEFDLEAVVDYVIDRHSRHKSSDRIYTERQHRERDVAACFLLDMSSSTHARISADKHVLDVEKEALLLMSEALEAVGDTYAIYGFSSNGRRHVYFYRFKEFAEPYGELVERRIGAALWLTNTRLGAAIRHSTWRLNQQPSATRLLIILSDAQPADDEYGDRRYAREDTRVALAEARASGVTPFCITFNQSSDPELEEMFENTGYTIIDNVLSLPERLPGIYRRLTM